MICKRRRQRRPNPNSTAHSSNRYIKVDGRIVGKNVGPNPVIFNVPNALPVNKNNNIKIQRTQTRVPRMQAERPKPSKIN
jgi:hypothetical protein